MLQPATSLSFPWTVEGETLRKTLDGCNITHSYVRDLNPRVTPHFDLQQSPPLSRGSHSPLLSETATPDAHRPWSALQRAVELWNLRVCHHEADEIWLMNKNSIPALCLCENRKNFWLWILVDASLSAITRFGNHVLLWHKFFFFSLLHFLVLVIFSRLALISHISLK